MYNHCFLPLFHIAGHYPVEINLSVSPRGNYSLSIFIEDDEGSTAESTVFYPIEGLSPTGWFEHYELGLMLCSYSITTVECPTHTAPAKVPTLFVWMVKDSPRLSGDSVEVDIVISRPTQLLNCILRGVTTMSYRRDCKYTCSY